MRAADSINVRFSDGTKIAGTVRQIDEVLGMAVVAVPSGNLPEEERKKVQVLSLANSYTVKAGDVLVGIGVRPDRCIRFRSERYPTWRAMCRLQMD